MTTTPSCSATLLNQAAHLWETSRDRHRDEFLAVGGLLQAFLEARAGEVAGLTSQEANDRDRLREDAVNEATRRLGCRRNRIYLLLAVYWVVRLLGDGKPLGHACYSTLLAFSCLVCRRKLPSKNIRTAEGLLAWRLAREQWELRPFDGLDHKAVFRRAVEEGWETTQARSYLARYGRGSVARVEVAKPGRVRGEGSMPQLLAIARESAPKDLAAIILDLVRASPRPQDVRAALEQGLARLPGAAAHSWAP